LLRKAVDLGGPVYLRLPRGTRAAAAGTGSGRHRSGPVLRRTGPGGRDSRRCAHRDRAGRGPDSFAAQGIPTGVVHVHTWRRSTGPRSRPWPRRRTGRHAGGARAQRRARLGVLEALHDARVTPVPAVAPARGTGRVRRRLRDARGAAGTVRVDRAGRRRDRARAPHARAGSTSPTSSARTSGSNGGSYPRMTPSAPDQ